MTRHFSMLRDFQLADWFTLANAFCGTGAIFAAMRFLQEGGVRALDERLGLCAGVAGKLGVHGAVARCAHAQALALPGGQVQAQLLQNGVEKGAGGNGHGRPER